MAGTGRNPAGTRGSSDREGAVGLALLTPPAGLPPVSALTRAAVVNPCTCGHGRAEHEHFRAGTDCGACGGSKCTRFHPVRGRTILPMLIRRTAEDRLDRPPAHPRCRAARVQNLAVDGARGSTGLRNLDKKRVRSVRRFSDDQYPEVSRSGLTEPSKAEESMKSRTSAEALAEEWPPAVAGLSGRTVTRQQVDQAVVQLRERRRLPAAEQMLAVLRALDLVVVPDPEIPAPREATPADPVLSR